MSLSRLPHLTGRLPAPSRPSLAPAAFRLAGSIGLAIALGALSACAGYSPLSLAPGSTPAQAEQAMGPRTGTHPLPDGGQRLEFARGPEGKQTYMLDYDAQGHLVRSEQVLDPSHFSQVRAGDTAAQVLARIGRPGWVTTVGRPGYAQTVWTYRYDSAPFCLRFQVGLDAASGRVLDGVYSPDPACESKD